jgi:hypothetical protein
MSSGTRRNSFSGLRPAAQWHLATPAGEGPKFRSPLRQQRQLNKQLVVSPHPHLRRRLCPVGTVAKDQYGVWTSILGIETTET